jgi:hypothetical protein
VSLQNDIELEGNQDTFRLEEAIESSKGQIGSVASTRVFVEIGRTSLGQEWSIGRRAAARRNVCVTTRETLIGRNVICGAPNNHAPLKQIVAHPGT